MLLRDILEEADLLVPNALSQAQKIRFANEVQRKLYRDYPLNVTSYFFNLVPGTKFYVLPVNCTEESIISVFVDEKEFYYRTTEDQSNQRNIYTLMNGQIFFPSPPSQPAESYIMYRAVPPDLTVDVLDEEPPFMPDFHELFVLGVAEKIALINKDFETAQQLDIRFQYLAEAAVRKVKRVKIKRIRTVRGWS